MAEVLERIIFIRGAQPRAIIIDNGPEFTGRDLDHFTHKNGIQLDFIRPGKPVENAFVESFNGKFRDECLNANWFVDLEEAKVRIAEWREDYNWGVYIDLCNRLFQRKLILVFAIKKGPTNEKTNIKTPGSCAV